MSEILVDWLMPLQAHGKTGGEAQEWVRAMLGTVGRGGNAQVSVLLLDCAVHALPMPMVMGEMLVTWVHAQNTAAALRHTRNGTLLPILLAVTIFKAV